MFTFPSRSLNVKKLIALFAFPEQSHEWKAFHLSLATRTVQCSLILLLRRSTAILNQLQQLAVSLEIKIPQFPTLFSEIDRVVMDFLLEGADGEWVLGRCHGVLT
jgi:hypothetical protein